jgi:hypothetical protein
MARLRNALPASVVLLLATACAASFNATPNDFVGTWARSTGGNIDCTDGATGEPSLSGNLVITLGGSGNQIVGTQPDGCQTTYTVTANTAAALPGQSCSATLPDGSSGTLTNQSHTLTLATNLTTIDESSSGSEVSSTESCTATYSGIFTLQ